MSNRLVKILLIEDEAYDVNRVKKTIQPYADKLVIKHIVADGQGALDYLEKNDQLIDVVIMDFQIVGSLTGESLIKAIKEIDSSIQIIVITKMTINVTDYNFANALLEAGAMWYCTKYPGDIEDFIYQPTDFILSILNAFEKRKLELKQRKSSEKLKKRVDEVLEKYQIIGQSAQIMELKTQIARAASQDATILITGESGTGKELVARHIHYYSKRKDENFVTVNSGSLPGPLIESELFGFEKGSFTGADEAKSGLFEYASGGSIFLDEIAELPLSAQVKLLRVLQEGEIDKIGRTEKFKVDARVIAATNKNLPQEINNKKFREDLFYRLNVISINVPRLQDRQEDIELLTNYFLKRYCTEISVPVPAVSPQAIKYLEEQSWPGNVRQLQNVVRRLIFLARDSIKLEDVHGIFDQPEQKSESTQKWDREDIMPWREVEREIKSDYFNFVRKNSKSDSEAARMLGLAPPNFYRMCKELGIK